MSSCVRGYPGSVATSNSEKCQRMEVYDCPLEASWDYQVWGVAEPNWHGAESSAHNPGMCMRGCQACLLILSMNLPCFNGVQLSITLCSYTNAPARVPGARESSAPRACLPSQQVDVRCSKGFCNFRHHNSTCL